ncbi:MAG TPA: PHB depolymerase family esterase, partial [Gemmatimonadales bacterium]|nr:PHB depolymerase family esterase [Gemmatimonadales bacterium]
FHPMSPRVPAAASLALISLFALLVPRLAAQTGSEQRRVLEVAGTRRSYALYLPPSHRRERPLPLVLVFHGAGGRGVGMARHTGMSRLAEREGFAVVYPDGANRRWNDGRGIGGARDDVGFIRALLDTIGREIAIDRGRIYATGISNGATFLHRLGCELPGVIAAIAPVAGSMPVPVSERCPAAEAGAGGSDGAAPSPPAVLAIQGTADRFMPFEGGQGAGGGRPVLSARATADFWARLNGCVGPAVGEALTDTVRDGTRLRRERYTGCRGGGAVELVTVEGGGHTWPGGPAAAMRVGPASREIDATRAIWTFFQAHPGP